MVVNFVPFLFLTFASDYMLSIDEITFVGMIAERCGGNLKIGILTELIFLLIMLIGVLVTGKKKKAEI